MIPLECELNKQLVQLVNSSSILVVSGLPGVGKSLYVNHLIHIAKHKGKNVTVIQWDIARKAFESDEIANWFPMGEGVVHNGVKLSVGLWLMDVVTEWIKSHDAKLDFLLIEAPLVGHRFIELMNVQEDEQIESFLSSECMKVVVPIPSKKLRDKIEADRRIQVDENAVTWMGAKHSVMLLIWKDVCEIANLLGLKIDTNHQPPYDPQTYEFVFEKVLRHRYFVPLHIDEVFDVEIQNEKDLHATGSLQANSILASTYAKQVLQSYPNAKEMDAQVENWFNT